jgi:hypothetical protein
MAIQWSKTKGTEKLSAIILRTKEESMKFLRKMKSIPFIDRYLLEYFGLDVTNMNSNFQIWLPITDEVSSYIVPYHPNYLLIDILVQLTTQLQKSLNTSLVFSTSGKRILESNCLLCSLDSKAVFFFPKDSPPSIGSLLALIDSSPKFAIRTQTTPSRSPHIGVHINQSILPVEALSPRFAQVLPQLPPLPSAPLPQTVPSTTLPPDPAPHIPHKNSASEVSTISKSVFSSKPSARKAEREESEEIDLVEFIADMDRAEIEGYIEEADQEEESSDGDPKKTKPNIPVNTTPSLPSLRLSGMPNTGIFPKSGSKKLFKHSKSPRTSPKVSRPASLEPFKVFKKFVPNRPLSEEALYRLWIDAGAKPLSLEKAKLLWRKIFMSAVVTMNAQDREEREISEDYVLEVFQKCDLEGNGKVSVYFSCTFRISAF